MARVKYDDGTVINFEGNPSQDDISDAYEQAKHIKGTPGNIPKSEGFLQKALKPVQAFASSLTPQASIPQEGDNPLMAGINAIRPTGTMNMSMYRGAQAGKSEVANQIEPNNPFMATALDMASDPETYVGFGAAKKGVGALSKSPLIKNMKRMGSSSEALKFSDELEGAVEKSGSSLSKRMGGGIEAVQEVRPGTVSFNSVMPKSDAKVRKLLARSEDLQQYDFDNLSLQDSQDVINSLKANLRQSLLTGDVVKSDERGILELISNLRKKQLETFPEFKYVLQNYGEGIEAYEDVAGQIPRLLESSGMNRIQRASIEKSFKKAAPEAFKKYKGYQNTKKTIKGAGVATGMYGLYQGGKKLMGG